MGEQFKSHVTTVLPAVIDRLGDSKDQVREMAQQLLLKLMMPASTPQVACQKFRCSYTKFRFFFFMKFTCIKIQMS